MSISSTRYVLITSAVGGATLVSQRELIGRLFSENTKTPVDAIVEFTNADDVGFYYGTTSPEYLRALFYFSYVAKTPTTPRKLSFGRFASSPQAALIFGSNSIATLLQFQAITAGTLSLVIGGQTASLTGLNFSTAVSYADVASILQTAIRAAAGTQFTTATVTYDAVAGAFNLSASPSQTAFATIAIPTASGASIADEMGWVVGAVFSPATPVQTIATALGASADISNNFGSFAFVNTRTDNELVAAAVWNGARNVEFLFCCPVTASNAVSLSAALLATAGVAMTLAPIATEYDEMLPMAILAATNYETRAAVQSYMFQMADLTPKVTTNALANTYDALRVNYYGNTQAAGRQINFFQRGVATGGVSDPVDINTYTNEMWFKDAASAELLSLLLAVTRVPANQAGRGQVLAILQGPIDRALANGVISVGKTLTNIQRVYVTQLTGDDTAWHQVQDIGYWVDCVILQQTGPGGSIEFVAQYTLVYSKDDTVRMVVGSHSLI